MENYKKKENDFSIILYSVQVVNIVHDSYNFLTIGTNVLLDD